MKILICSSAFYPENSPRSFRATELAKEFARQGHSVKVISLAGEGEAFCKARNISFSALKHVNLNPINFVHPLIGRILNRILLMLFEYPGIKLMFRYKQVLKHESGYDLLISVAVPYPVHWGVAWARSSKNRIATTWIADCGDPYMGNESDSFRKFFYFKYIEKWMFRKVDHIVIPLEGARSAYYEEFHTKISIIPQGINFEELGSSRKPYSKNGICTLAYAGTFILGFRDPRKFLEYLLQQSTDFRFLIFSAKPLWLQEFESRSNGRIVLKDFIPRTQLIGELSQVDFLVNIENSTTQQAPSKLIDYFVAERPILNLSSFQLDYEDANNFLKYDFSASLKLEGMDNFRIENVVSLFLNLKSGNE